MKYSIIIVIILNIVISQEFAPSIAPVNPHFIKYLEDKEKGLFQKINSEGYYNAIIPHPTNYKIDRPKNFKVNTSLPDHYDLRTEGLVTPVKDQGDCGSCYLFASIGSLESYWKKLGLGTYDLSENHAGKEYGFEDDPCGGGNGKKLTPYFLRGDGPISEADDPYALGKKQLTPLYTPQGIVTEARFFPNDMDVIKQHIFDYGGIYSSIQWLGEFYDYYNQADNTFFYSSINTDTTDAGHAIVLVGWDEYMQTAGGTGAWIVKNSWGNTFGEDGYFYMSYQDVFLNEEGYSWPIGWPGRIEYNSQMTIYYYDKFGSTSSYGWVDGPDYALIKFNLNGNEKITRIGTYVVGTDAEVQFDIYDNFDGTSLENLLDSTDTYKCDYPGYYSFDLPNPMEFSTGEEIYVKVKYYTPHDDYPIPVEKYFASWGSDFNPQIETDCFWISNTGAQWTKMGENTDYKADPCIKLYTTKSGGGTTTQTIIDEGFDTATWPPTGWTQAVTNTNNTWMLGNPTENNFSTIDPNSQSSAICPYDDNVYQEEYLYTPLFALPIGTASLEFYSGYSTAWIAGATMNCWITIDSGDNWTKIWEATNDGQPWGWRKQELDLSAYAGNQNVALVWGYVGQGGDLVGLDGVKLISNGTVGIEKINNKPKTFSLEQNFPNPFNPSTTINFQLSNDSKVNITIYDLTGREIIKLVDKSLLAGQHTIQWNGTDAIGQLVSGGLYFYKLEAEDFIETKKMIFIK